MFDNDNADWIATCNQLKYLHFVMIMTSIWELKTRQWIGMDVSYLVSMYWDWSVLHATAGRTSSDHTEQGCGQWNKDLTFTDGTTKLVTKERCVFGWLYIGHINIGMLLS